MRALTVSTVLLIALLALAAYLYIASSQQAVSAPPQAVSLQLTPTPPAQPQNTAVQAPSDGEWTLIDQRAFSGRLTRESYHPYYVLQAEELGLQHSAQTLHWHFYDDEPIVDYRPDEEYLLDSSRVMDRWVRLAKQVPHTLRWELEFVGGGNFVIPQLDGVIIGDSVDHEGLQLQPDRLHKLIIERQGTELRVQCNEAKAAPQSIAEDDRTPPRVVARVKPVRLRSSRLYFGKGEKLAPPPPPKPQALAQWEKVFSEDFSRPESMKLFVIYPDNGRLAYNPQAQCLAMGHDQEGDPIENYVLLRKSLPGDLRIRFRARSTHAKHPAFFGLMLNLAGRIQKLDGYFVEWNYWQVQIKKKLARTAGVEVRYANRNVNDWMTFSVERVGGKITMYTQGEEVLSWTDPYPPTDSAHDLFLFYSCGMPMEFDDLSIERNKLDGLTPRPDDPALPANYKQGKRDAPSVAEPPDGPSDEF